MMAILLLTRPAAASARTRAEVERRCPGARIVVSPVIEIVPADPGVLPLPAELILTSENGAEAAAGLGLPAGLRAWCVGAQTAAAARAAGFDPVSAAGDAEALLALILSREDRGLLLHLRGEHARGDIAPRLRAAGRQARDAVVYRQEEQALGPEARAVLAGAEPVVLPLYSPRSAAILAAEGPFAAPLRLIAISPAARRAAGALATAVVCEAARPDGEAMLAAICASLTE
jgi:uroporphyrinogen-III synthase